MQAIILFAHGARDPAWAQPFERMVEHLRRTSPHRIALAFLELMQPGLEDAVRTEVNAGCTAITVVPVFLGAGGHVRRDLPALIDTLRSQYPDVTLRATCAVGESPEVMAALADAALRLATESP